MNASSFDPHWEQQIYGQGKHLALYPYDCVVTFVYRNAPRDRPRSEVRIVEIGCGAGNNLWFAAREGFSVAGLDGSPSAVEHVRRRFAVEGLTGDFQIGDFTRLPWPDASADLVIDRGALTCVGRTAALAAVGEVWRILKPGGKFFCNPYSRRHASHASGLPGKDDLTAEITGGTLTGVGAIRFYDEARVRELFPSPWLLLSMQHTELVELIAEGASIHAEWRVIAAKPNAPLEAGRG